MPLRGPRFSGDPVLEECLTGGHRMMAPEEGLPVKRVQAALVELGFPVGPHGTDGSFGPATGDAVSAYKRSHRLSPADAVVGPGTAKALDDDLFVDPPGLDPAFAEFAPMVVDHRVEPFVALELVALLLAPFDSWRHMLGRFALGALSSGQLLGIVAQSRVRDLRGAYLAVADPVQEAGTTAEGFFDLVIAPANDVANTMHFLAGGQRQALITIRDTVILGRENLRRRVDDGTRAPVELEGVVMHEVTHARNLEIDHDLELIRDDNPDAYADTALAQARSATGTPTMLVMRSFVREMVARHVHWIGLKERAGTPGVIAVRAVRPEQLAAAALFYFVEVPQIYDRNGYGAAINAQGDSVRAAQLERWLRLCATQSFSDVAEQDRESTLLFEAAAKFWADQQADPTLEFPAEDGVFPLPQDFR